MRRKLGGGGGEEKTAGPAVERQSPPISLDEGVHGLWHVWGVS